jgi:hypothetical protein
VCVCVCVCVVSHGSPHLDIGLQAVEPGLQRLQVVLHLHCVENRACVTDGTVNTAGRERHQAYLLRRFYVLSLI